MRNFLINAVIDLFLILISYFLFRRAISGPTRHRLYEKMLSSFAKFVIFLFIVSLVVTGLTALIFYRTRFVGYINVIAPAVLSVFVGFVISTVPTRGAGDEKEEDIEKK